MSGPPAPRCTWTKCPTRAPARSRRRRSAPEPEARQSADAAKEARGGGGGAAPAAGGEAHRGGGGARSLAKDPDGEVSLFSSVGDAFAGASAEIEKQLAEVNKRAASLRELRGGRDPSRGRGRHEQAQRAHHSARAREPEAPEETEEEKRKRRKLSPAAARLESAWTGTSTSSPSASKPFKFKSWELEAFKGTIGALAREACASGLLNEIILDFQNEILENLTKDIKSVGDGLLSVRGARRRGVGAAVVDGIASGPAAAAGHSSLVDTGEVIAQGPFGHRRRSSARAFRTPARSSARAFRTPARSLGKGLTDTPR